MCLVSDNIKLCTCEIESGKNPDHYWRIERETESEKEDWIVGIFLLPADIGASTHEINKIRILNQLNNKNCFDQELIHKERDLLILRFRNEKHKEGDYHHAEYFDYTFNYKEGKWHLGTYFSTMDFEKVHGGEISEPFDIGLKKFIGNIKLNFKKYFRNKSLENMT